MKQVRPYPRVIVTKKAARSLKSGHPWVFEGEVIRTEPSPANDDAVKNGCVVDVFEENGTWQGAGLISLESKIRVRIVSRNANDRFDNAFWSRRVQWAWDHRKVAMGGRALPGCEPDTNCCRIIFSEADGLPGLIVDRYEDVLVSQVGTVGMERLKGAIYPLIIQTLRADGQEIRGIYERNDSPARAKDGLGLDKGWYDFSSSDLALDTPDSARVTVRENGIAFDLDIENSQKTGFFLDQKYNRRAVRDIAGGRRVLDCFCHVGPFGLNAAAGGAEFVRCVDVSQAAIDLAGENARLNKLDSTMGFTCANVLEYLPELAKDRARLREEGGPFDLIVLDPPAFTKSRGTVNHASKGYREINQAAMRLLPRGGYLATCSCSHFMTRDLLAKAIAEAAHNANVQLKQVQELQQAPDHPILWGVPETHYLDFFIFQVI
ncbi:MULTISPECIES: class I SAM-dependent rRNA methyltransferase [Atopobiaceae]|uniref:SAM-dependent methyltransferase n=1 Tax=Parafannyhessea umbonata TaxID=604330 RepID=A0A1H6IP84_9ACTN|nr:MULTISPECIES: class I SAM-dependent rRNA methyltransferase [Atopobiaceae]SEH48813.1 SAM-dependent methyltransferase [Parafannyhessea umbonata]SJZ66685.1 23S rRNA (cytosine1962-C5)-methyltransferase [Olsenella sp. KH1P3]